MNQHTRRVGAGLISTYFIEVVMGLAAFAFIDGSKLIYSLLRRVVCCQEGASTCEGKRRHSKIGMKELSSGIITVGTKKI